MQKYNNTPSSSASCNSSRFIGRCPQGGVLKANGVLKRETLKREPIFINDIEIKQGPILELPYNNKLKERAKLLRQARNLPEVLFWMQVTKGNFHKIDFDRQRIIGNYIVDFYIKALGVIIEIDGSSHDDKEIYDKNREEYFVSFGLKVYRISVDDIMKAMSFVLMGLEEYIIKEYGVDSG